MVLFIQTTTLPPKHNIEHVRYVQDLSYISSVSDSFSFDNSIDMGLNDIENGNIYPLNPNGEKITEELLQKNLWDKIA